VLAEILPLYVRLGNRARVEYRRLLLRRWCVSRLWRWEKLRLGFFGHGEEVGGVTVVHLVGFPALLELLAGVLPDGFEHPAAHSDARWLTWSSKTPAAS
jgi:hypothetical protein